MEKHIIDEKNGLSYTLHGDYYLPDLEAPKEVEAIYGYYGQKRLSFLKENRKATYTNLLTSCTLVDHLNEVDDIANEMLDRLTKQMAKAEGLTEQMKTDDQMNWVRKMNNIYSRAREIVLNEIIYV